MRRDEIPLILDVEVVLKYKLRVALVTVFGWQNHLQ